MSKIYWIGARASDVEAEDLIAGSITRYGNNENNNISFCQNNFTSSYDKFLNKELTYIIHNNPNSSFLFANETFAYKFGKDVFQRAICLNKISVIESLNDKIFFRQFINNTANVPPSIIINMYKDINYDFIKSVFDNKYSTFVLQTTHSAGGEGSVLLQNNLDDEKLLNLSSPILITPFISNAIPINVHIAISKDDIRVFPPSVQLIYDKFYYCGADFIKFDYLDDSVRKNIINYCYKIAEKIQTLGAIGVFGVDLMLVETKPYFIECNFRYQGSTFVLNKGLMDNDLPSMFKVRYKCFYDTISDIPTDIYNVKIKYSSFRRTEKNKNFKLPKPVLIKEDGRDISSPLRKGYIQYELFDKSIFNYFEK